MKQGSQEWLEVRRGKITSTDAPIIMGCSKFGDTPLMLWKRKSGLSPEKARNAAMQRGHDLEGEARDCFTRMTGIHVYPRVVFSDKYDFAMASFDGIDLDDTCFVEIKCPNKDDHAMAAQGMIPEAYQWQMYHQWACFPTAQAAYYFSYFNGEGILVMLDKDKDVIADLMEKEQEFYECLITGTPPALTEDDRVTVEADFEILNACNRYLEWDKVYKEAEEQRELAKKFLVDQGDEGHVEFCINGESILTMDRVMRKGSIDWGALCKDKGISVEEQESYRKPQIGYYSLSASKPAAQELRHTG